MNLSESLDTDYLMSASCKIFFFLLLCTLFGRQGLLFMNNSHCLLTFQPSFISSVGPMNSAQDSQTSLFKKIFIKNGSHGIIHTFKIYFVTVFSVSSFSKISSIQTDPKSNAIANHLCLSYRKLRKIK